MKLQILSLLAVTAFSVVADSDPFANAKKIMFVGNSITRHSPKPAFGWNGNRGMASSDKSKDYVHVLISELDRLYPETKHEPTLVRIKNEAGMTGYKHLLKQQSDLIIIQLGENFRGKNSDEELRKPYEQMLIAFKKNITPNIICVGTWGLNPKKASQRSDLLELAARNQNIPYIYIGNLGRKEHSAFRDKKFDKCHRAVRWHPSDLGMRLIAERILELSPRKLKPAQNAEITVYSEEIITQVNRKIMGQMMRGADSQYIWSTDKPDMELRRDGWGMWDAANSRPNPLPSKLYSALRPGVMRYPGGSSVKNYNWKLLVGPIKQRQQGWHWGLTEFIDWCRSINTEPQICLSSYCGTPEDQRDMVEFLNAPAIPKYPWAMKRAEWGHPEPYGIKYFELGNEPGDGNRRVKPRKQWTVDGYIAWAEKTINLIRKVDSTVKLGLPLWGKDQKILRTLGAKVDFIIHHTYSVYYAGNKPLSSVQEDRVMRACMAAVDQYEYKLQEYKKEIKECIGRDLPLGITEYNTNLKSKIPRKYRMSLGAGLFCLDYVFRMFNPETGVLLANYWNMYHGYWGGIRGQSQNFALRPPYFCYKLAANNLGDEIVKVKVNAPMLDFEGFCNVDPANGNTFVPAEKISDQNLLSTKDFRIPQDGLKFKGGIIKRDGNGIKVVFSGMTNKRYPGFIYLPMGKIPQDYKADQRFLAYDLSFEAKWLPEPGCGKLTIGLGLMDGRGWERSGSANRVEGAHVAIKQWKKFSGKLTPLQDCPALAVIGRFLAGSDPVSGTLLIRNIAIKPWRNQIFPAYKSLSVLASKSKDGKKLFILAINKYTDRNLQTAISIPGYNIKSAKVQVVNGSSAASTAGVTISPVSPVKIKNGKIIYSFEPHSMTAITLEAK